MPAFDSTMSLNTNLAAFGFRHILTPMAGDAVVDGTGATVFAGNYREVVAWLCGVDLRPLIENGWEARWDDEDGRPVLRYDDGRPERKCTLTPPRWPMGGPGTPLILSEWQAVPHSELDAMR